MCILSGEITSVFISKGEKLAKRLQFCQDDKITPESPAQSDLREVSLACAEHAGTRCS